MTTVVAGSAEEGPALRGAAAALERVVADEAAATVARERYRDGPLPSIDADERILEHLTPGESVHGLRTRAILREAGGENPSGYGGSLYLTSRRLVHLAKGVVVTVMLTDIVETSVAGERLLLTLCRGDGLILHVEQPRLFRTEMAATMRELRR